MAALGHTVDSGSGASGDYASLNALESAQDQDLTDGGGDTYTATCITTGDFAIDSSNATFIGWTTGVANWIKIAAGGGHEGSKTGWSTSKYRLEVNGTCLEMYENYMYVENLQIRSVANEGICIYNEALDAGNHHYLYGILIDGNGAALNCIVFNDSDAIVSMYNDIVCNTGAGNIVAINILASTTVDILNCIVANHGDEGINRGGGTVTVKNTAVFGIAMGGGDFVGTITVDHCASDDGDGTNARAPSGGDWANEYAGHASNNFTLTTGGNCEGGGTDNPGSGLYSTDIDGDAYTSTWSIGVDAKTVAGGVAPTGVFYGPLVGPFGGVL